MNMGKMQLAQFCAFCGAGLVAKMVAKDGSIICIKCRVIDDAKTQGQAEILKLVRTLEELETQVPRNDADFEDATWVETNIFPIENELARALRAEFFISADTATDKSQEKHSFEEWINILTNELKSTKEFPLTQKIRAHIEWLCEDMLELNEASKEGALKGDPEWTKDDFEYEAHESDVLSGILAKLEKAQDTIVLTKEEADALSECNEMDMNDTINIREHHQQAIDFQKWLGGE